MSRSRVVIGMVLLGLMVSAGLLGVGATIARIPAQSAPDLPQTTRPAPKPYVLPIQYAAWVIYYCDEQGAPVWLAARLFAWESGWNAAYTSRRNENGTHDRGLTALNDGSLEDFRKYNGGLKVNPYDPETAVRVGVRYIAALHAELRSWRSAVGAYNVGLGAWRMGKRPERHMREVFGE